MSNTANAYTARYPDLEGRSVFISGGASGIGAEMVLAFASQGCRVCFIDIDVESAEALVETVARSTQHSPVFEVCDVTETENLRAAIERIARDTGNLAVLVNNAARDLRVAVDDVTPEQWDDLAEINLKHQFFAAQAARPFMAACGGGSIINFGSIAPTIGITDLAVYSSCKAAVFGLTRTLAREFGRDGVRVNSIVPGAILTARQLRDWISEDDKASIIERQCLKRALAEDDVAEMALFLGSNASRGCTGQEFRVDGGNF